MIPTTYDTYLTRTPLPHSIYPQILYVTHDKNPYTPPTKHPSVKTTYHHNHVQRHFSYAIVTLHTIPRNDSAECYQHHKFCRDGGLRLTLPTCHSALPSFPPSLLPLTVQVHPSIKPSIQLINRLINQSISSRPSGWA